MNCSTSTIGITTAVALFPDRGTAESAMPSRAEVATPSTKIQANVSQAPGSVGIAMPNSVAETSRRSAACSEAVTKTWPILPRKYDTGESGVPPSRFRVPSPFSVAISTARFCTPESSMPAASMPGR